MTCDCHKENNNEDVLSPSQKEIVDRIEFAVGYAMNINFTNHYKRQLMKDIIDSYIREYDIIYMKDEDKRAKIKSKILEDIEKIAVTDSGYDALKEYVNIIFSIKH